MDRVLDEFVSFDVSSDVVRIVVRGILNLGSRPHLVHIFRRVRRANLRCHICVDLSHAALVESFALAGLRHDLNLLDASPLLGGYGAGISLRLSPDADSFFTSTQLTEPLPPLTQYDDVRELFPGGRFAGEFPSLPVMWIEKLHGRPLREYSNEELLETSDGLFSSLDSPQPHDGADLLGRYNDVGLEISRRQHEP
ncbi:hypothetical protein ACU18_14030 [Arthrobacter sp. ZBG10]|nr:hypothetical protein ACU18_14030 [Arthrobacter sp. ZBG10]